MSVARKQPRPHQLAAIDGLRAGIRRGHRRLLLVMLMGAGKTITALEMIRLAVEKCNPCLFLCDRRMIADQGVREADDYGLHAGLLMAGRGVDLLALTQFASKQTLESWLARDRFPILPDFKIIVVDEAHRASSTAWRKLLERWPDAIVIGLTATPCHGDGSGLGDFYEWMVQPIKPSELLARELIVPAKCYAPHVPNLKGVGRGADGDYSLRQLEQRLNKANLVGDVVGWWKKLGEDRTSVYFATEVSHALSIRNEFRAAGITAEVIDQDSTDEERASYKARLKDRSLRVLVSVDVMTEGVDIPEIQLIGLVRPTKRLRRYLQMVGRGLRPCPEIGKFDCLVIDHGGCVLYHGFPGADHEWTLDTKTKADEVVRKRMENGELAQPIVCPKCSATFSGTRICPVCGHELKRKARAVASRAGTLVAVGGDGRAMTPEMQSKIRRQVWFMAISRAIKVGAKATMAAAIFRNRFGIGPEDAGVEPMPVGGWWKPAVEAFPTMAKGRITGEKAEA